MGQKCIARSAVSSPLLILSTLRISESYIKTKINLNLYFQTFEKYFQQNVMKAFKTFIKSFEATQRSAKIKFKFIFFFFQDQDRNS